ncbi:MAG: hypothetical protein WCF18_15695 [Chthoniobacteraceae bacterium]
MKPKSITTHALCAVVAVGMCAIFPATAHAKEPKKGKKSEASKLPPEGQELDVKAADLTQVTYKGPARVQPFTQTGPKLWRSAGNIYDEVDRDEFSIYLIRAKTDNERVQIDLHARVVSFFTGPVAKGPDQSYPILSASSGTPK